MKPPRTPSNEAARLADLHQYDVLNTAPEPDFDSLADLAAQVCHCPAGAVTFIDGDRQWIKGRRACTLIQTPRHLSFCGHTILQDRVLVIEDTLQDARFRNHPHVTGVRRVRFYAGAPITSPAGYKLGSVCVIDEKPNRLSAEQSRMLQAIATQASQLLAMRMHNRKLKTTADTLLLSERLTAQHTLRSLEQERAAMAYTLHENMGQVLAAVQLHLNMAESQPELTQPCIKKAQQHINDVIAEMRRVSYELLPVPLHSANVQHLVQNLISQQLAALPAVIDLECTGTPEFDRKTGLAVFRILEDAFQLLKQKTGVTLVSVKIKADVAIEITLQDDGHIPDGEHLDTLAAAGALHNRIRLHGGTFNTHLDSDGLHTLVAALPLQPAA